MVLASTRVTAASGGRVSRTLLAIEGDRLALEHFRFTRPDDAPFEVDTLHLTEVDAEGRFVAVIVFDPDDRRAASLELLERYARSDEARWWPASVIEFWRAMHDHDLARIRAALPGDFVFHDHRRMIGLGRLAGADDYVASAAALFALAPDVTFETLYHVAAEKHGDLAVAHQYGTLAEGGEFESVLVRLTRYHGQRFVGVDLFDLEDLDVARARFEELRPDPLRIPPNAASRARDDLNATLTPRVPPT